MKIESLATHLQGAAEDTSASRQHEAPPLPASSGRRVPRYWPIIAAFIFFSATLVGCGYHVAGKSGKMPGDITSLSIPIFTNSTSKPDIESTITQAFANEFVNTVKVTGAGSAVMKGNIISYDLTPVSYTQNDVNMEYRLTVTLSLSIIQGDKVVWEDSEIIDYEDFRVNITDVSATNEDELAALKKIAQDTARFTKERMLEKF